MKIPLPSPRSAVTFVRSPRARKLGWWIFGVIAAFGVLGALVAPPIARSQLEQQLTKILHRKVAVEAMRINPYTLSVTLRGFRVQERDGNEVVFSVEEANADVSVASLFRIAPVLTRVRIVKPRARVVRLEANRYNWSDLIDEFVNKPRDPNEPPARFAIANIEVTDGGIDFNDRPEGAMHVVDALQLAVPFLSSLPVHQEVNVEPKFSARVNGSPVEFIAKSKLFKDSRDSTLNLDVRGLDLTRFLEYVPGELPLKIRSARLETDLDITFAQPAKGAPSIVLSGKVALSEIDIQEPSGAPLLKVPRLAIQLRAAEPLARRVEVAQIAIESPEMRLHRRADSEFLPLRLFAPQTSVAKPDSDDRGAAPTLIYQIDEIALTAGKMEWIDDRASRPVRLMFDDIRLALQDVSNKPDAAGRFEARLRASTKETLELAGSFGLQPLQVEGTLKVERARLPTLWPYVEPYLALNAAGGDFDVTTTFIYSAVDAAPNLVLKDLQAALRSLTLRQSWDEQEIVQVASLKARAVEFELRAQTVKVGELTSDGGRIAVHRDRNGKLNLQKLPRDEARSTAAEVPAASAEAPNPWLVTLNKLAIERYAATVEDAGTSSATTVRIDNLALTASNLSTGKGERSDVTLKLTLNKTGSLSASGPVVLVPPSARLKIDVQNLGIVAAQPYFEHHVNAIVAGGDLTVQGDVVFDLPENGAARGEFKGDVTLANFGAVTKAGNEDLLRWKSLHLGRVDTAIEPFRMAIAEVSLSDFYTRLVLTPEGRLNLQGLLAGDAEAIAEGAKPAAVAPGAVAVKPAPTSAAPKPGVPPAQPPPPVQIGKIALAGGNVNFSDLFIKPNYSANLTDVAGSIGTITPATAADIDLRAKIDSAAPVEITGRINPLARDLFLDIKASARDIELAPLTPYSAKYAGYGIEKGKLSMKVAYHLENRKLTAQNNVILNQLTFGAKVDSPTATKLPVLFAVSLLKDRNGVIDINLPVSGSIDDPQFSIGGIIGRVIVNLLVKIVTSPFALIGAMFGGGEELSYVEFTPGSSALTPAAHAKLNNLIKALTERPALSLDVAGRVDAETDREGLRKSAIERKVKAQKLKDVVKSGNAAGTLDQVTIESGEYPKYLARAYSEEKFPKPRNAIGLVKELPVSEMEQLMTTHASVTEEDLRQIANQRAQRVKDYLVETGKIPAERVFLLAPKLTAEGVKDEGSPARVDFALK